MSDKTLGCQPGRERERHNDKQNLLSTRTRLRRLARENREGLASLIKPHLFNTAAGLIADQIGTLDDVAILMCLLTLQHKRPDLFQNRPSDPPNTETQDL